MRYIITLLIALTVLMPIPVDAATPTATLSAALSTSSVTNGSNLTIDVKLSTGGQAVSGVTVALTYSSNLTYVGFDASGSVMSSEVSAPSPSSNRLSFTRLRFDSGYTGDSGTLGVLTFKATEEGAATVAIDQANSQVIPFSDENANILQSVNQVTFSIVAAASSQPSATTQAAALTTHAPTPSPSVIPTSPSPKTATASPKARRASPSPKTAPQATVASPESSLSPEASVVASPMTDLGSTTSAPSSSLAPSAVASTLQNQSKKPWPDTTDIGLLVLAGLLTFGALPYALYRLRATR